MSKVGTTGIAVDKTCFTFKIIFFQKAIDVTFGAADVNCCIVLNNMTFC